MSIDPGGSADRAAFGEGLRTVSQALRGFAEATMEYERLLEVIASTLSGVVGDGCVVRLLGEGGWLAPAAICMPLDHIQDPPVVARVRAHVALSHHVDAQPAAKNAMDTGVPLLVPELDLKAFRSAASPEIVATYEAVGIHSLLIVPLRVRRESVGILSLVRYLPGSAPFDDYDRDIAQALADHAALAIANARLLDAAVRELSDRERAEEALRRTEAQLRHAQKMEAVGRLAGGIAHDFNNLLSVILSYAETVAAHFREDEPARAEVEEIARAGLRAAELTRQLLSFSRNQQMDLRTLNLSAVVSRVERMLARVLGADVELTTLLDGELGSVSADPGQVEQIVMNLAVNARDAMPHGGKLTIETANVELDDEYARTHYEVVPGQYVLLAVTDTGAGMDRETQARIFEPFFTTKDASRGTGLGLATVFGIVKQSGGHIWVYSEPGKGTTFKVYLPRTEGKVDRRVEKEPPPVEAIRGSETILLVEDNDQVRVLARTILRRNGYLVLEASNAGEALLICEQHGARVHLLVTDVILPRMSGPQLAERLSMLRPDMKVLFMSGYTDDAVARHGLLDSDAAYLQKPLLPGVLLRKVREALNR